MKYYEMEISDCVVCTVVCIITEMLCMQNKSDQKKSQARATDLLTAIQTLGLAEIWVLLPPPESRTIRKS
jgi:hypothetical protein